MTASPGRVAGESREGGFARSPKLILAVVSFGSFMSSLDMSIINIVTPVMAREFGSSLAAMTWVINAYLIANAALVILCGRLGDMFGHRRMFLAGATVFTVASVGCAVAPNLEALLISRAVQGVGSAMLYPQAMAIIVAVYPAAKRGAAIGIWSAVSSLASVLGPLIGGTLTSLASWRANFVLNLPIGIALVVVGAFVLPAAGARQRQRLDWLGATLVTAALVGVSFGLIEGEKYHWGTIYGWISIPLILVLSVVFFAAFVVVERRKQGHSPLISFQFFRDRNYTLMVPATTTVSLVIVGTMLPMAMFGQYALDFSPAQVGALMFPIFVTVAICAPLAGKLADRIGGKRVFLAGPVFFGVGILWFVGVADIDTWWLLLIPGLLLVGMGLSCTFTPLNSLAMHNVPKQLAGSASGILHTARQFGSVIGGSVMAVLMQAFLASAVTTETASHVGQLPASDRASFEAFVGNSMSSIGKAAEYAGTGSGGAVPGGAAGEAAAREILRESVVSAVRPTLLVLAGILMIALVCAAFARSPRRQAV
ncbi:MFS transporter [Amycolatopsis sp. AA4]|uniref:DHA2 family efflux MFS transporter permease subunit n=1 Tax=Actinomycetes TaxID=1760 RepID=UPI000C22AB43|nr:MULTISPECIES: DHA2 family efflux MFS transporter permease subunit [Actinomycetes]ATY10031.1 MFS transporter [Amycolatopsis sp. AA4]